MQTPLRAYFREAPLESILYLVADYVVALKTSTFPIVPSFGSIAALALLYAAVGLTLPAALLTLYRSLLRRRCVPAHPATVAFLLPRASACAAAAAAAAGPVLLLPLASPCAKAGRCNVVIAVTGNGTSMEQVSQVCSCQRRHSSLCACLAFSPRVSQCAAAKGGTQVSAPA